MKLTTSQLATLCKMSRFGFYKLANNLGLPYKFVKGKIIFDTNATTHSDFFRSVERALDNDNLQPFYSIKDLADKRGQSKNTIKTLLTELDIKIYKSGNKWIVLLVDLEQLARKPSNQHSKTSKYR